MKKIAACLWFNNQAEEAMKLYTSLFEDSSLTHVMWSEAKTVQHAQFVLNGQRFTAMDSNAEHGFSFIALFPLNKPLPLALVRDTVKFRLEEH